MYVALAVLESEYHMARSLACSDFITKVKWFIYVLVLYEFNIVITSRNIFFFSQTQRENHHSQS